MRRRELSPCATNVIVKFGKHGSQMFLKKLKPTIDFYSKGYKYEVHFITIVGRKL